MRERDRDRDRDRETQREILRLVELNYTTNDSL